jgi:hypothetical protein
MPRSKSRGDYGVALRSTSQQPPEERVLPGANFFAAHQRRRTHHQLVGWFGTVVMVDVLDGVARTQYSADASFAQLTSRQRKQAAAKSN